MSTPAGVGPYHAALLEARRAGLVLAEAQRQQLLLLLEEYAAELAKSIGAGTVTAHAERISKVVHGLLKELSGDLAASTAKGVGLTARTVAEIHAAATAQLLKANGVAAGVALTGVNLVGAAAVLARPQLTAAFQSIAAGAQASADRIIQTAVLQGQTSQALAQRLRLHILGADKLPEGMVLDRRTITYAGLKAAGIPATPENLAAVRRHAGGVAARAELIARTEINTAAHEAGIRAAEDSPVVDGVQWYLSNRHPEQDECDAYAKEDWHGKGPGIFDPRKVPPLPHPRCLCGRRHVLRPVADWKKPKPKPAKLALDPDDVADKYEFPPSRRKNLRSGIAVSEGRNAQLRAAAAAGDAVKIQAAAAEAMQAAMAEAESAMAAIVKAKSPGPLTQGIAAAQKAAAAADAAKAGAAKALAQEAIELGEKKLVSVKASYQKYTAKKAAEKVAAAADDVMATLLKDADLAEAFEALSPGYKPTGLLQTAIDNGATMAAAKKKVLADVKKLGAQLQQELAIGKALGQVDDIASIAKGAVAEGAKPYLQAGLDTLEQLAAAHPESATLLKAIDDAKALVDAQLKKIESVVKLQKEAATAKAWADAGPLLSKIGDIHEAGIVPSKANHPTLKWKKSALQPALAELEEMAALIDTGGVGLSDEAAEIVKMGLYESIADLKAKIQEMTEAYAAHAAKYGKKVKKAAAATPAQTQAALAAEQSAQAAQAQQAAVKKGKKAAEAQAAAAARPPRVYTADEILHRQLQGPGGSNPGGIYEGKDGVKRYVKFYDDAAQARGEQLANEIYRRLGLEAPESITFMHNGKLAHATPLLEVRGTVGSVGLTEKLANEILDGFAADVLTANWDAVGLSLDNVVVLKNGRIARIDQGGSFLMRAQKGRRKAANLLEQITEWENFTNHTNPAYASVFEKAGIVGAEGLGQRIIAQIDEILALEKKVGGWDKFVADTVPGWTGADRQAVVKMLEARTKLLSAKRAEVRTAIEEAKRAAIEQAKLQKQLAKRLKAGKSGLRPEDIRQISEIQAKLTSTLTPAEKASIQKALRDRSSYSVAGRSKVHQIRREALTKRAQELGLDYYHATRIVDHYDNMYASWTGSASSSGAAGIKWLGAIEEGGEVYFHDHFIDRDRAKQAAVMARGKKVATENGLFKEEHLRELFRTDRNMSQAFGESLTGQPTFKIWRRVRSAHFREHGVRPPKLGDVGYGQQNSVSGWTWIRGSYSGDYEFEAEISWRDMVSGWWHRSNGSYDGENEVWIVARGDMPWKVTKTTRDSI